MRYLPFSSLFGACAVIACGAFVIQPRPAGNGKLAQPELSRMVDMRIFYQPEMSEGSAGEGFTGVAKRERMRQKYEEWCGQFNVPYDPDRLEIFAYHYLLAEDHSRATGQPLRLNQFAAFTEAEYEQYMQLQNVKPPLPMENTSQSTVPRIASRGNTLDNNRPYGRDRSEIRFNRTNKWNVGPPKRLPTLRETLHGAPRTPPNSVPRMASRGNSLDNNRPYGKDTSQIGFQKTDVSLQNNHNWNNYVNLNRSDVQPTSIDGFSQKADADFQNNDNRNPVPGTATTEGSPAHANPPKPTGRYFAQPSKWNVGLPVYYMNDKLKIKSRSIPHDDFDPFGSAYYGLTRNLEAAANRPQDPWLHGVDKLKESRSDHLIRVGPLHIQEATHFWMGHR